MYSSGIKSNQSAAQNLLARQSAGVQKPPTGKQAEVGAEVPGTGLQRLVPCPRGDPALGADRRCGQQNTGYSVGEKLEWFT